MRMAIFILSVLLVFNYGRGQGCNVETGKEIGKGVLEPYIYDASKITYFYPTKPFESLEFEVPLFSMEKYKVVFVAQGNAKNNVEITIWDRPPSHTKRKKIFSSSEYRDALAQQGIYQVEVSKGNAIFVEYKKRENGKPYDGCIIFLLGFAKP